MPSTREAAATETAAVNAAVAAAAAAAEAAAASKARRTRGHCCCCGKQEARPQRARASEKPDLPREPGDGVEIMDDEGFSGGGEGRGPQHDDAAQRRRGCCRASPRAAARPY